MTRQSRAAGTSGNNAGNVSGNTSGTRLRLPSRVPGDTTHTLVARAPTAAHPSVSAPSSKSSGKSAALPALRTSPVPAAPTSTTTSTSVLIPEDWPTGKTALGPKAPKRPAGSRRKPWLWRLIGVGAVVATAIATLGLNTVQALQEQEVTSPDGPQAALIQSLFGGTPAPSGHAPPGSWNTAAASVKVVVPPTSGEPCHDLITWPAVIDQWMAPPGCYGEVFRPNPANYPSRPGFGWCNWWVRVNHPDHPDVTENKSFPSGSVPHAGDAVFFDGGVQGADRAGHWAEVVAVDPDGYWVLISEMNFSWRGAGWARVDYRYIHVGPGVHFIYVSY